MKTPKHTPSTKPPRTPTQLTRLHTAFIKAVALGEAPTRAARRIAKDPDRAAQLMVRYTRDPATHLAVKAEIQELIHVHALPLAMAVILETLRNPNKDRVAMAQFVYKFAYDRLRASDTDQNTRPAKRRLKGEALKSAILDAQARVDAAT